MFGVIDSNYRREAADSSTAGTATMNDQRQPSLSLALGIDAAKPGIVTALGSGRWISVISNGLQSPRGKSP